MQSIQLGIAAGWPLKVLKCGFTPPLMITYDLIAPATGGHLVVAMVGDGVAANGQPQSHYHVRKLDLTEPGDIDLSVLPSWGRFASPKIGSIAAHGDEFVLALSPDLEMVEILRLPKQPYGKDTEAEYASQIGKEGRYVGLLKGSRAMALAAMATPSWRSRRRTTASRPSIPTASSSSTLAARRVRCHCANGRRTRTSRSPIST